MQLHHPPAAPSAMVAQPLAIACPHPLSPIQKQRFDPTKRLGTSVRVNWGFIVGSGWFPATVRVE